jgi:hypothetical protein
MTHVHVSYELNEQDLLESRLLAERGLVAAAPGKTMTVAVISLTWFLFAIAVATLFGQFQPHRGAALVVLFWGVGAASLYWGFTHYCRRRYMRHMVDLLRPLPLEQSVSLSERGIRFENRFCSAEFPWSSVASIHDMPYYIGFRLHPYTALLIPNSAFQSLHERNSYLAFAQQAVRS